MRRTKYILLFIATYTFCWAQPSNGKDPKSKSILEKLSNQYEKYETMEVSFDLILDLPDQESEIQKGQLKQKGEKYWLDLSDQAIYSDGTILWLHLKDNNEVQINDAESPEDEESFLTPKDMMRIYESDDYSYTLVEEKGKGKSKISVIEFKPNNPDSEYAKLRLSVSETKNEMKSMIVFSKDGSKYTLEIKSILSNKNYEDSIFVFDATKFPGIHVEDLRL